jgi:hypothetical protein
MDYGHFAAARLVENDKGGRAIGAGAAATLAALPGLAGGRRRGRALRILAPGCRGRIIGRQHASDRAKIGPRGGGSFAGAGKQPINLAGPGQRGRRCDHRCASQRPRGLARIHEYLRAGSSSPAKPLDERSQHIV